MLLALSACDDVDPVVRLHAKVRGCEQHCRELGTRYTARCEAGAEQANCEEAVQSAVGDCMRPCQAAYGDAGPPASAEE